MRTRILFFLLAGLFILPVSSNGQVGNILRNKINKAINKKVEEKIDTAIDKSVKDAQKTREKETEQAGREEGTKPPDQGKGLNIGSLLGGKVTSKYNDSYSFNNRIYMVTEMYDNKDVMKMDYYIYYSDTSPNGGFESKMISKSDNGEEVAIVTSSVFDGENKIFLLLTDMGSTKMGIISEVPDENTLQDQPAEASLKETFTKTGNSRIIAGYKCDEYLYKDNESKDYGKLWVTKDLKLKADKRTFSKAGLPDYYGNPDLAGGTVLAMESYNEKNELVMKSETKEINTGFNHTISTTGYALRQMNFNQAGGQQKR
jgi:hypothetical protein